MTHKGFPVDEIRGRLLHEALLAEAREAIEAMNWPGQDLYEIPDWPRTDTGSMRVVAS